MSPGLGVLFAIFAGPVALIFSCVLFRGILHQFFDERRLFETNSYFDLLFVFLLKIFPFLSMAHSCLVMREHFRIRPPDLRGTIAVISLLIAALWAVFFVMLPIWGQG
jgi:hypothetical protein